MSSRAVRSSSNLQAARSAVAERARRAAGPRNGSSGKAGAAGKAGQGKPSQAKSGQGKRGQKQGGQGKPSPNAKSSAPPATPGKAPRSTKVVLRRIHPTSVLRISVLFYLSLCLALLTAGILLWVGANVIGLVSNIEGFMDEVGFTDFRLRPGPLLVASALASVVLVVVGSLANYLMAVLYNLIGDVVGGIKVVLTEDPDITPK